MIAAAVRWAMIRLAVHEQDDGHQEGILMARIFGEVPGYPVGTTFASRAALSEAQVHRPTQGGTSGNSREGADSIVVSGGYEDDVDLGDELIYTGHGGNNPATKQQVADQVINAPGNAGLVRSQLDGLPVRVIRGARGDPAYSPPERIPLRRLVSGG
jgi:putative restriction endonuclease